MIHVLAHALTTRLHFATVSNIVLVSCTVCRISSLLILSTLLIFSILLQIHISMASNPLEFVRVSEHNMGLVSFEVVLNVHGTAELGSGSVWLAMRSWLVLRSVSVLGM